jgi:hypothetical protein
VNATLLSKERQCGRHYSTEYQAGPFATFHNVADIL